MKHTTELVLVWLVVWVLLQVAQKPPRNDLQLTFNPGSSSSLVTLTCFQCFVCVFLCYCIVYCLYSKFYYPSPV